MAEPPTPAGIHAVRQTLSPPSGAAIEARGLAKAFGASRAVDGVDLTVAAGTGYGVPGPHGAGKTTTISMLATLLKPDAGRAEIFGHDVQGQAQIVRQLTGVTGQYASADESLSATENLVIFSRLLGYGRRAARARAADLLEEFGLAEAAGRLLQKFSGGMRRRLDPRTRTQMWETSRRLVATGSTVLLTTQYLDEADRLADRIAVIDEGRVVAEGTADELKASVGTSALQVRLEDPGETANAGAPSRKCPGQGRRRRAGPRALRLPWPTTALSPSRSSPCVRAASALPG